MTTAEPVRIVPESEAETIKDLICYILEIDADSVTSTSLFKEDHGADSLRAIEILAALERMFKITIEQSELGRMVNLDGVHAVIASAAGWVQAG